MFIYSSPESSLFGLRGIGTGYGTEVFDDGTVEVAGRLDDQRYCSTFPLFWRILFLSFRVASKCGGNV